LKRAHPDAGGSRDLFLWTSALYEHVSGDEIEQPEPRRRREPPPHPPRTDELDRIPFEHNFASFAELTAHALLVAETVAPVYARLLRLLADCEEAADGDRVGLRAQSVGSTYRSLAAIAHRVGMSKSERVDWYEVARYIPLAERHSGHIHKWLSEEEA
jgi:hypothetical protein